MNVTTQVNNNIVQVDLTYTVYYVQNYRTFRKLDLHLSQNCPLFIHFYIKGLFNSTFNNSQSDQPRGLVSESLPTNHEVPGSIPGSTWKFSLKGRIPAVTMVWVD